MKNTNKLNIKSPQKGVVLIVALIILVAMTLGGLALIRSMDTSTLIAANISTQQSAIYSSDEGIESAVAWLESNLTTVLPDNTKLLDYDYSSVGYTASATAINANQTGEDLWSFLSGGSKVVCTLPRNVNICDDLGEPDASGNTVQFVIQRLCNTSGPINGAGCTVSQATSSNTDGENQGAGEYSLGPANNSTYYRITVRAMGARNAVSYVQAVVNL